MTIEIEPFPSDTGHSNYIDTYCKGGGNGKQAHFLVHGFDNGGAMITRFEPISMKGPRTLKDEIRKD